MQWSDIEHLWLNARGSLIRLGGSHRHFGRPGAGWSLWQIGAGLVLLRVVSVFGGPSPPSSSGSVRSCSIAIPQLASRVDPTRRTLAPAPRRPAYLHSPIRSTAHTPAPARRGSVRMSACPPARSLPLLSKGKPRWCLRTSATRRARARPRPEKQSLLIVRCQRSQKLGSLSLCLDRLPTRTQVPLNESNGIGPKS